MSQMKVQNIDFMKQLSSQMDLSLKLIAHQSSRSLDSSKEGPVE